MRGDVYRDVECRTFLCDTTISRVKGIFRRQSGPGKGDSFLVGALFVAIGSDQVTVFGLVLLELG